MWVLKQFLIKILNFVFFGDFLRHEDDLGFEIWEDGYKSLGHVDNVKKKLSSIPSLLAGAMGVWSFSL